MQRAKKSEASEYMAWFDSNYSHSLKGWVSNTLYAVPI